MDSRFVPASKPNEIEFLRLIMAVRSFENQEVHRQYRRGNQVIERSSIGRDRKFMHPKQQSFCQQRRSIFSFLPALAEVFFCLFKI